MKKIGLVFFLVLIIISDYSFASESIEHIILKKHTHLNIEQSGSALFIKEEHYLEKKFFRNFEKYAKENIYFSNFDNISSLKAYTEIPHKNRYKTIKVKHTETSDIVQPGIFYGGYKKFHFVYPGLVSNAISKLEYTKTINDPHFILPFYFQEDQFIRHAEYSVSFPKSVKIKYKLYGNNADLIQLDKVENGNTITYRWTYSDVEPITFEQKAPSRNYLSPHIIVLIDSYHHGTESFSVSSDVGDLYRWYYGLTSKIDHCDHKAMMNKIGQIIKGPMSPMDSIQSIFRWVQKNIKYVAFEDGMAGFIPRSACDVIHKRYGDCKDMANLLKVLYQSIGVDAHLTWIGTRMKPYSYYTLPSTITDNHMICSIKLNDNFLYLDATNPFSDFGMPTSMIQGKKALIGINKDQYEINKVPVIGAEKSIRKDLIHCSLNENDLTGSFESELTGYMKEQFQYSKLKAEVRKEEEFLRDHISIGENSISIMNEKLIGLDDQSNRGKVHFKFNMPNYCRAIGKKYYINLNLYKQKIGEKLEVTKRIAPVEEDFKYLLNSEVIFDIPEGYKVSFLPENKRKEWKYGLVETKYENKEGRIYYYKVYKSDFLLLQHPDFVEWNQFIDDLSEVNQETIILEKI